MHNEDPDFNFKKASRKTQGGSPKAAAEFLGVDVNYALDNINEKMNKIKVYGTVVTEAKACLADNRANSGRMMSPRRSPARKSKQGTKSPIPRIESPR